MFRDDLIAALVFLALTLAVGVEAFHYDFGRSMRLVGPGFFPMVALTMLAVFSVALLLASVKDWSKMLRPAWPARISPLLVVTLAVAGYAVLLPWLGFLVTNFIFSAAMFRFGYPDKWLLPLGGAAVTSLAAMLVFEVWLNTQFPPGLWRL